MYMCKCNFPADHPQNSVTANQKQMWHTPTKQGISRTGLFWDMDNWSWHGVKNNSSVDFEIFCFCIPVFYHLHIIYDWFSNIFPHKKNLHFLQPIISKTIEIGNFEGRFLKIILLLKPLTVYTNHHISKIGRSMLQFGIK